jgi:ribonuclease HI
MTAHGDPLELEPHPFKVKTPYAARLQFQCTNNIAEYKALLLGIRKLKEMGIIREVLKSNS